MFTRIAGMPAPIRDEQYNAIIKTRPTSGFMASVNGSNTMIALAALNPGSAPTTYPNTIDGMITHQ